MSCAYTIALQNLEKLLNLKSEMSHKKVLISNFLSLSGIQIASYILPLITVPYLVRIIGPEKFGLIAFTQAFVQYFVIITEYGFNLSATREISIHRNNKERVSEIFNSVIIIKTILMSISFLILCLFIFNIGKFKAEWLIYFFAFGMVVGNLLFPIWFFQGMEKMRQMAMLSILSQAIFTACIFIFIKDQNDYIYVPLINSAGLIISGILSLHLVFKKFGVRFFIPPVSKIKHELKEGWHIFVSTVAISLYTVSNIFILGLFTSNTIVGYYAAGFKIIEAINGLFQPASQTLYPYLSRLTQESARDAIIFLVRIIRIMAGLGIAISIMLFIFSGEIVKIILGSQYTESVNIIKILSLTPFINVFCTYGTITLLVFGFKRFYSQIIISGALLNIALLLILVPFFNHMGAAASYMGTIIFLAFFIMVYLHNRDIKILSQVLKYG